MDYLLHRCSGSTLCHYTKRIQRGAFSALARRGLLPTVLQKEVPIYRGPLNSVLSKRCLSQSFIVSRSFDSILRTPRSPVWPCSSGVASSSSLLPPASLLIRCHNSEPLEQKSERNLDLPLAIQLSLDRLHGNILTSLAPSQSPFGVSAISDFDEMVQHYFQKGGKLIRPTVALLMAGAANFDGVMVDLDDGAPQDSRTDLLRSQEKIAVISEMIHTASLVHDDVIDEADLRRNSPTVNTIWGNKKAILVGDYILAKATQLLCTIGDAQIISILAQVIEDLVKGEFMQMGERETHEERFLHYIRKSFKKTASLFAHSCKAVATLAPHTSDAVRAAAFEYGKNLGLAFQLVDDLLDFAADDIAMGKRVGVDLKLGLSTAPVIFAARQFKELEKLMKRGFTQPGDVEQAWDYVMRSDGIEETRRLASTYSRNAIRELRALPSSPYSAALEQIAEMQIGRQR